MLVEIKAFKKPTHVSYFREMEFGIVFLYVAHSILGEILMYFKFFVALQTRRGSFTTLSVLRSQTSEVDVTKEIHFN